MASPPSRTDLAGTPTVATYKLAIGALYDYVASLLGNGTATVASETEKKLARESLGVGNFGFKNRLINPEFSISQAFGFSSIGIVAGAGPKYLVDRWYATCAGANVSAQLINGISDNIFSLRLTGATSNTAVVLGQRIEALNCYDLRNKQITVSLKSKSTSNKTIAWNVYCADVTDVFAAKTLVATGTINVTTSVEKFSFTFNAGSNAGNGLAVEFYVPNLLAGSTIDFDSIQLEQSAIATEFEKRSVQNELALSLRYFWAYGYSGVASIYTAAYGAASTTCIQTIPLPVKMRANPTVAIDAFTLTNNCSSPVLTNASPDSIVIQTTVTSTGRYVFANLAANTGIKVSAEL